MVAPGSSISLGDRSILVPHTPGHTPDSITLVELSTALIFSGDFICPGPLLVFLPGSAMGDYLEGAKTLLESAQGASRILSAHRMASRGLPELSLRDVEDLEGVLEAIYRGEQSGEGLPSRCSRAPFADYLRAGVSQVQWKSWPPRERSQHTRGRGPACSDLRAPSPIAKAADPL